MIDMPIRYNVLGGSPVRDLVKACQLSWNDPKRWEAGVKDSRVLQHKAPTPEDPNLLHEWDLEDEGLMRDEDHCGGCHEEGEIYTYRLADGRKARICCCGSGAVEKRAGKFLSESACPADGCLLSGYHHAYMTWDWRFVGHPHRRRLVQQWA